MTNTITELEPTMMLVSAISIVVVAIVALVFILVRQILELRKKRQLIARLKQQRKETVYVRNGVVFGVIDGGKKKKTGS